MPHYSKIEKPTGGTVTLLHVDNTDGSASVRITLTRPRTERPGNALAVCLSGSDWEKLLARFDERPAATGAMDDQTIERTAKLSADNLRLRDEVKLLNRRLTRAVPVGAPDSDKRLSPTSEYMERLLSAANALAEERLGELEALQKQYGQLREEWEVEHEACDDLREKLAMSHSRVAEIRVGFSIPDGDSTLGWLGENVWGPSLRADGGNVEARLQVLEAHCFPNPDEEHWFRKHLDTPKDTDEG